MLSTFIQRYDKSSRFLSSSKTRDKLKFYRLSEVTFYDHIDTLYRFIKPFLNKKCLISLRNMEPLKSGSRIMFLKLLRHTCNVIEKVNNGLFI